MLQGAEGGTLPPWRRPHWWGEPPAIPPCTGRSMPLDIESVVHIMFLYYTPTSTRDKAGFLVITSF